MANGMSSSRTEIERFILQGKATAKAGWASVNKVAAREIDMLDYAAALSDVKAPPGNPLEPLRGTIW